MHNFVRYRDGFKFDDTLEISDFEEPSIVEKYSGNQSINRFRDALSNYFVSAGQLDWQMDKI